MGKRERTNGLKTYSRFREIPLPAMMKFVTKNVWFDSNKVVSCTKVARVRRL